MKYLLAGILILCGVSCTHTGTKAEIVIKTWEGKPKPAGCVHVVLDGSEKAKVCAESVLK